MKPADDAKASSNSEAKSSLFNKNTEQSKLFGGKSGEGKESVDSKPSSKPFAGMGSTNDDRRERSNADNEVEKKIEEKKSLFNTVPKKDGAEKSVLGGLNTKIAESEKSDSKTTADAKSLFGVKKSEPSNQIIAKPEDEKKQLSDKSSVKTISGLSDGSKPSPFGQSKAGESSIKNPNVEKVTGNKPFTIGGKIPWNFMKKTFKIIRIDEFTCLSYKILIQKLKICILIGLYFSYYKENL